MAQERITSTRSIFTTAVLAVALVGASLSAAAQTESAGGQVPAVNHNTWSSGTAMPTARFGPFTGAIGKNIYVVGGATNAQYQTTAVNEIYSTTKKKWTTGAPDPTARALGASAVVNGILYVIGGSNSGGDLNLVEAYDPVSNTWSTKASMPTPRNSMAAAVDKGVIYVIGGYNGGFLTTVESYNTTTDTWAEEAPLLLAKAWQATGLLGGTIMAADGNISAPPGYTGDNEGYNVKKNKWTTLTADPTPRLEACFSVISGKLYVAGGWNGTLLGVNEAYSSTTKSWTTLASMPNAVETPGSAVVGGRLYCIGGSNGNLSTVFNYVQIYQP